MKTAFDIKDELFSLALPGKKQVLSRFYKTGEGEYGADDQFIGVTVPQLRLLVKQEKELSLRDIEQLLMDPFHECRMIALFFLIELYKKKNEEEKEEIFHFYLGHIQFVNNWDLVDLSAPAIVGDYLLNKDRDILYRMAKKEHLWTQRTAVVSTIVFIRKNDYSDILRLAEMLLSTSHDLMRKAIGWMLREVGKRNYEVEYDFLKIHYKNMPRTMLRYAIERFEESVRKDFLTGKI